MNKGFENIIYFKSNVNEVYTLIKINQYLSNLLSNPIELSI